MKKPIYTCLWFESEAQEAASYYCSIFDKSEIIQNNSLVSLFRINGQKIMAINGGPKYKLSPAVSLVVECDSQTEIDHYWKKLTEGGREDRCGWLTDKFGLSWQIIPSILGDLMSDPKKASNVMNELLQMKKIEMDRLLSAK